MSKGVSVPCSCPYCLQGDKPKLRRVFKPYFAYHIVESFQGQLEFVKCSMYDRELRHAAESMGFYMIAWRPVHCRNGYWRWLRWVEQHSDGTYSLGNRAH
jgi:hypothetical protein